MNLSQIKLVVTDMDGTLLNSKHEVSPLFFDLFKKLKSHNILFVAASGRPYYGILDKLNAIKDDITIVAENGAIIIKNEQVLLSTPIGMQKLSEINDLIGSIENTHPVFCTKHMAYVKSTSKVLLSLLSEYYANYIIIDHISEIEEEVYKVALYHQDNSEKHIYPHVKHLEPEYKVKVSANHWVDISDDLANKGHAIKLLQDMHNITQDETMAFGDYNNDIEMLKLATYSYAMENAHQNIKDITNYMTKNNDNFGVEVILEKLIKAKESIAL